MKEENTYTHTTPPYYLLTNPQHPLGPLTIQTATPRDLAYIDHLQRKHVNNTGFVPRAAIADHLERRSYHLVKINGQPTGYAMHAGGIRRPYRMIQIAIDEEAWRHGIGKKLIDLALAIARTKPHTTMTGTIRQGLTVHHLVTATGAVVTGVDTTPKARNKPLIHYAWIDSHSLSPARIPPR